MNKRTICGIPMNWGKKQKINKINTQEFKMGKKDQLILTIEGADTKFLKKLSKDWNNNTKNKPLFINRTVNIQIIRKMR